MEKRAFLPDCILCDFKMKRKTLTQGKAELFRILYIFVWDVLIMCSLFLSLIFLKEAIDSDFFTMQILLPALLAVTLFYTEITYVFLFEKYKGTYKQVFEVMVTITIIFLVLILLIAFKNCLGMIYGAVFAISVALGYVKWLKTDLLPYKTVITRVVAKKPKRE